MAAPRNRLYYGDNLDVLRRKVASASVDLLKEVLAKVVTLFQ